MPLQTSYFIACPYCLEHIEITVDLSAGTQQLLEDCEVCCNPILLDIQLEMGDVISIDARRGNE